MHRRMAPMVFVAMFFTIGLAHASSRDTVMSGSARCAILVNDREWLACYYGAAQPMRLDLGLTAAPDKQVALVPLRQAATAVLPAQGGARDAVMSGSARCAALEDNRAWLTCYYGAAQPMRSELGLGAAPLAQTQLVPTGTQGMLVHDKPPRPQGFFQNVLGGQKLTGKSRMASYGFDAHGIFQVTMTNGEVWQQVSGDTSFAHWNKPAARYLATLYSGALGSISMRVDGDSNVYKVRRRPD